MDECEESLLLQCEQKLRDEVLFRPGFPTIKENFMLCACEDSILITRLRKVIVQEASNFKVIQ